MAGSRFMIAISGEKAAAAVLPPRARRPRDFAIDSPATRELRARPGFGAASLF
jgi:hypothetical protein